jgi:hypothetical protein
MQAYKTRDSGTSLALQAYYAIHAFKQLENV